MAVGHAIRINDDALNGGYWALDPKPLLKFFQSNNRPTEEVEKCNRFILPVGREYGRGWVLMNGRDAVQLYSQSGGSNPDWNAFTHAIRFQPTGVSSDSGIKIKKLGISRIHSVTGWTQDYISSPTGLSEHFVIVEFVDARYVARMTTLDKSYNVRAYNILDASDNPTYWDTTLNGANTWSWSEVVTNVLTYLPSNEFSPGNVDASGAIYPSSIPENLKFPGICAWDALCEILHNTGNLIWRDKNGKWYISSYQTAQTDFNEANYQKWLKDPGWDLPRSGASTKNLNVPNKLVVYFPQMYNAFQGLADTKVVDGGDATDVAPLYSVEKTINPSGMDGTKVGLFSPLFANYDEAGTLLNGTALTNTADAMANAFKAAKGWSSSSRHNIYLYYHDIPCGSDVSAVQWYNTGNGATTEIIRNPFKYIPGDEHTELGRNHKSEILAWENFATTDQIREHNPVTRFAVCKVSQEGGISANGVGTAKVLYGTHSSNGAITWVDSGKTIYVHEIFGSNIEKDKRIACHWHLQTRRWIAIYVATDKCIPELHTGTLQYDMCPTETGTSIDLVNICDCTAGCGSVGSGGVPVTLKNPYKLAGRAGRKVFVYHTKCGGVGGNQEECVILQVEHEAHELIENNFEHTSGQPCDAQTGQVDPAGICKVYYDFREYSVMTCKSTATQATLFTAERVDAITDWWVDGLEIKGEFTPIWVVCICDPYTVVLHIGTDCAYGSGTGG